jgi:dihydroneopterin aldolase
MSVYVRFDCAIRLYDDDVPETLSYAELAQAVQNVIGHTGATVEDVTEYEDDGIDGAAAPLPEKQR